MDEARHDSKKQPHLRCKHRRRGAHDAKAHPASLRQWWHARSPTADALLLALTEPSTPKLDACMPAMNVICLNQLNKSIDPPLSGARWSGPPPHGACSMLLTGGKPSASGGVLSPDGGVVLLYPLRWFRRVKLSSLGRPAVQMATRAWVRGGPRRPKRHAACVISPAVIASEKKNITRGHCATPHIGHVLFSMARLFGQWLCRAKAAFDPWGVLGVKPPGKVYRIGETGGDNFGMHTYILQESR